MLYKNFSNLIMSSVVVFVSIVLRLSICYIASTRKFNRKCTESVWLYTIGFVMVWRIQIQAHMQTHTHVCSQQNKCSVTDSFIIVVLFFFFEFYTQLTLRCLTNKSTKDEAQATTTSTTNGINSSSNITKSSRKQWKLLNSGKQVRRHTHTPAQKHNQLFGIPCRAKLDK